MHKTLTDLWTNQCSPDIPHTIYANLYVFITHKWPKFKCISEVFVSLYLHLTHQESLNGNVSYFAWLYHHKQMCVGCTQRSAAFRCVSNQKHGLLLTKLNKSTVKKEERDAHDQSPERGEDQSLPRRQTGSVDVIWLNLTTFGATRDIWSCFCENSFCTAQMTVTRYLSVTWVLNKPWNQWICFASSWMTFKAAAVGKLA